MSEDDAAWEAYSNACALERAEDLSAFERVSVLFFGTAARVVEGIAYTFHVVFSVFFLSLV